MGEIRSSPRSARIPACCQDAVVKPRPTDLRRVVNTVTMATPLGLALARFGRATLVRGPDGLLLALDYRARVPAPRAPAVTVGDVVLLRMSAAEVAARPALLLHERR